MQSIRSEVPHGQKGSSQKVSFFLPTLMERVKGYYSKGHYCTFIKKGWCHDDFNPFSPCPFQRFVGYCFQFSPARCPSAAPRREKEAERTCPALRFLGRSRRFEPE